jgi:hypothetical protein
MRPIHALLMASIAMLVFLVWFHLRPPVTGLAACAAAAKSQGLRSTSCTDIGEIVDGDLSDLLSEYSLVTARLSRPSVLQTQTESAIFTWDVLREARVLSRVARREECRFQLPKRLNLQIGEIAIPRYGGTAVISGVRVDVAAGWRQPFEIPSQRYVFFADVCSDQLMLLPMSGMEVYGVNDDERLWPARAHVSLKYQRQIEGLGTLDALRRLALHLPQTR